VVAVSLVAVGGLSLPPLFETGQKGEQAGRAEGGSCSQSFSRGSAVMGWLAVVFCVSLPSLFE
jgi:hypothetical protein